MSTKHVSELAGSLPPLAKSVKLRKYRRKVKQLQVTPVPQLKKTRILGTNITPVSHQETLPQLRTRVLRLGVRTKPPRLVKAVSDGAEGDEFIQVLS